MRLAGMDFLEHAMKQSWFSRIALALVWVGCLQACGGGGGASPASGDASPAPGGTEPVGPGPASEAFESPAYLALAAAQASSQQLAGRPLPNTWAFDAGAEYPGARGGLVPQREAEGHGVAGLLADLNCGAATLRLAPVPGCGLYVAMTQALQTPLPVAAPAQAMVTFEAQTTPPFLLETTLRVVDRTGQVLQLPYAARSLEAPSGGTWSRVKVPIGNAAAYWGGAQDGRLHEGVGAVALTAGVQALAATGSTLQVRDLRLQDSAGAQLALSRHAPLLADGVEPSLAGRLAVASPAHRLSDQALGRAASVGISVVRIDMFWRTVETDGRFDFSAYDQLLLRLARHGLSALFILDYGHPAHGDGAPLAPADRAAYAAFARQAAAFARGRNVVAFEVWNEPDTARFWPQGDPDTFAPLLRDARLAIHGADPARKVLNGGPSWVNLPYILRLARTGALAGLDGFAVHAYRNSAPESLAADVAPLRAVLASNGVTAPLWGTEWGYPSFGKFDAARYGDGHDPRARQRQGVLMLRAALTQVALNLPLMTLYELCDSGTDATDGEHNFGLLTAACEPKPAFAGLQALHGAAATRRYVGLVKDVPANVHAMRWDGPQDSVFAVWTDAAPVPLALSLPPGATATSWTGQALVPTVAPGAVAAELRLTEADGPVFVRFAGRAPG
jgi:hypothetical protein